MSGCLQPPLSVGACNLPLLQADPSRNVRKSRAKRHQACAAGVRGHPPAPPRVMHASYVTLWDHSYFPKPVPVARINHVVTLLFMHISQTGLIVDQRHYSALAAVSWSRNLDGYYAHHARDPVAMKTRHMFSINRKVWELEYGLPVPKIIDHINRTVLDNRVENLRAATPILNGLNRTGSGRARKRDLPMGVDLNLRTGSYSACIRHGMQRYYTGGFSDPEEAGRVVAINRQRLIDYEAAIARGEHAVFPLLERGERRRKIDWDRVVELTGEGIPRWEIAKTLGTSQYNIERIQSLHCPPGMEINTSRKPYERCRTENAAKPTTNA